LLHSDSFFSFHRVDGVSMKSPVIVTDLLTGGPALSTGKIMPKDELVAVDGTELYNQSLDFIHNLIWYVMHTLLFTGVKWRERCEMKKCFEKQAYQPAAT
jgi:hypothetical protein